MCTTIKVELNSISNLYLLYHNYSQFYNTYNFYIKTGKYRKIDNIGRNPYISLYGKDTSNILKLVYENYSSNQNIKLWVTDLSKVKDTVYFLEINKTVLIINKELFTEEVKVLEQKLNNNISQEDVINCILDIILKGD